MWKVELGDGLGKIHSEINEAPFFEYAIAIFSLNLRTCRTRVPASAEAMVSFFFGAAYPQSEGFLLTLN